jgi:hypothetical protein
MGINHGKRMKVLTLENREEGLFLVSDSRLEEQISELIPAEGHVHFPPTMHRKLWLVFGTPLISRLGFQPAHHPEQLPAALEVYPALSIQERNIDLPSYIPLGICG